MGVAAQRGRLLSLSPQEILTGQERQARAALQGQQGCSEAAFQTNPQCFGLCGLCSQYCPGSQGLGPHLHSFPFLSAARVGCVSANPGVSSLPLQLCQVNWTKCQFIDHSLKNVGHVN